MSKGYLDLTREQQLQYVNIQDTEYYNYADEVACPFCKEKQNFEWEDMSYEDENIVKHECYSCGNKFDIRTRVETEWVVELPDEEVIKRVLAKENEGE